MLNSIYPEGLQSGDKMIFTPNDINLLDSNKSEVDYKTGEMIVKQGALVSQVLFLNKGLVKLVVDSGHKRSTILEILRSGSFLDLSCIDTQKIYPFSIIALKPSLISHINKSVFDEFLLVNDNLRRYIMNWYCSHNSMFVKRISVLSTRNNYGKLASALVYLMEIESEEKDIFKYITRKDLAELSAISLESVNKILVELKNDRIIEIHGTTLSIICPDLIKKLSTVG